VAAPSLAELNIVIQLNDAKRVQAELLAVQKELLKTQKAGKATGNSLPKKQFKGFSGILNGLVHQFTRVAVAIASFAIVIGSLRALTNTIHLFADFEQGLIAVGKTTGLVKERLANFGAEIVSLSLRIPVATDSLLGIAEAAGQLGISSASDLIKFTETISRLGSAASSLSGDLGDTALQLARILSLSGEKASDIDKLTNVIVHLGNEFATTEAEIVGLATRIAQSTVQFDLASKEIVALSAASKALGLQTEATGSAFGRAFNKIQEAIITGNKVALAELERLTQLDSQVFAQKFEEDKFRAFALVLRGLSREGDSVSLSLKNLDLVNIRDTKTIKTLSKRYSLFVDVLDETDRAAEENNATLKESETAFESLNKQAVQLGNSLRAVGLEIGETVLPALKSFIIGTDRLVRDLFTIEARVDGTTATIRALSTAIRFLVSSALAFLALKLSAKLLSIAEAAFVAGRALSGAAIGARLAAIGTALGPIGLAAIAIGGLVVTIQNLRRAAASARKEALEPLPGTFANLAFAADEAAHSAELFEQAINKSDKIGQVDALDRRIKALKDLDTQIKVLQRKATQPLAKADEKPLLSLVDAATILPDAGIASLGVLLTDQLIAEFARIEAAQGPVIALEHLFATIASRAEFRFDTVDGKAFKEKTTTAIEDFYQVGAGLKLAAGGLAGAGLLQSLIFSDDDIVTQGNIDASDRLLKLIFGTANIRSVAEEAIGHLTLTYSEASKLLSIEDFQKKLIADISFSQELRESIDAEIGNLSGRAQAAAEASAIFTLDSAHLKSLEAELTLVNQLRPSKANLARSAELNTEATKIENSLHKQTILILKESLIAQAEGFGLKKAFATKLVETYLPALAAELERTRKLAQAVRDKAHAERAAAAEAAQRTAIAETVIPLLDRELALRNQLTPSTEHLARARQIHKELAQQENATIEAHIELEKQALASRLKAAGHSDEEIDQIVQRKLPAMRAQLELEARLIQKIRERALADQEAATFFAENQLLATGLLSSFNNLSEGITRAIVEGENFGDVMKNVLKAVLSDVINLSVRMLLFQTIFKDLFNQFSNSSGNAGAGSFFSVLLGSLGGANLGANGVDPSSQAGFDSFNGFGTQGNALGAVYNHGNRVASFARGGVFNNETSFPVGRNTIGRLGEAGPEAIMPLTRLPGGGLGVGSAGGGTNVTFHNTYNFSGRGQDRQIKRSTRQVENDLRNASRRAFS